MKATVKKLPVDFSTERKSFKAVIAKHTEHELEQHGNSTPVIFAPVGVLAVDSFKMRLPLHKAVIVDSKLNKVRVSYIEETGETDGKEVKKAVYRDVNGVSMTCSVHTIEHGDGGLKGEYIFITVHAKKLGAHYFEGMTMARAEIVYKAIVAFDVVHFSYADFLTACVTDVDIKQDFICMTETVKERCYAMAAIFTMYHGVNNQRAHVAGKTSEGMYTGHSFYTRNTASFKKAPYMKVYYKSYDCAREASHRLFFTSHGIDVPSNLWRQEFTLKNKKHMQLLNIESTVQGVLSANVIVLREAMLSVTKTLFTAPMRAPKIKGRYTPREKVDMRFMWLLLQNTTMSSTQIIDAVCFDLDKSNKAKYMVKLTALKSCDTWTAVLDMQRRTLDAFLGV